VHFGGSIICQRNYFPESEQSCTWSLAPSITILCALWIIGPLTFLLFIILLAIDNQGNFTLVVGMSSYFLDQLLFVKYDSEYYFFYI